MEKEIKDLIKLYAEVYKGFEMLQKGENPKLASGDQKTGVIAEYYAKCYIQGHIKDVTNVYYAKAGAPHDITYSTKNKKNIRVQVKGVSAHSQTRTIAPLNLYDSDGKSAFDELFLIDLDYNFLPIALYINRYSQISERVNDSMRTKIVSTKMKSIDKENGSAIYDFKDNRINDLLLAIK